MKTISNTALKKAALLVMPMIFSLTTASSAEVTGPYFGQTPPGRTPEIFAPGILSLTNRLESSPVFSPDGTECFFTVWGANFRSSQIYYTKRVNDVWTPQVEAPFSMGHYAGQPFFSKDGNRLYFGYGGPEPTDIWVVQRTAQGWSNPQVLPAPINSSKRDIAYTETADGTVYFTSDRPGGKGKDDLWRARPSPGQPLQAENLTNLNTSAWDAGSCMAPDGSYLIFTSERPGGICYADLYVTFADGNGGWSAPANLNHYCPGINARGVLTTTDATLSPDGNFLFFVRYIRSGAKETRDVYWVANPLLSKPAGLLNGTNTTSSTKSLDAMHK